MEDTDQSLQAGAHDPARERVQAKRDEIERELKKCPDFQLYLLIDSLAARARMERHFNQNPNFRLWRALTDRIGDRSHEAAE